MSCAPPHGFLLIMDDAEVTDLPSIYVKVPELSNQNRVIKALRDDHNRQSVNWKLRSRRRRKAIKIVSQLEIELPKVPVDNCQ